jgi:hypothetical protein
MMKGGTDGARADVTRSPGAVDGVEARKEVILVGDSARDQQIHTLQARDRVDHFVELERLEEGLVEVGDHTDYDFIPDRRAARDQVTEASPQPFVHGPVKVGREEEEVPRTVEREQDLAVPTEGQSVQELVALDLSSHEVAVERGVYFLAANIVEAILDGRQPQGLRLAEVLANGPLAWEEQRVNWCFGSRRGFSTPVTGPRALRTGNLDLPPRP